MPKVYHALFESITSPERLFAAWQEFRKGKSARPDVQEFEVHLEEHIFALHRELISGTYRHGSYSAFTICDPKQRPIHKAIVRDRVLHHAVFAALNPIFEPTFIAHSYSCRRNKGTHRGVDALKTMLCQVSRNNTRACFALKCDIRRFFASVDHKVLLEILARRIKDDRVMRLLENIVVGFSSDYPANSSMKGIPIGNLTSQLFANVYLNEFDQYMKHTLKIRHYIRYTDDFIIVADDEMILRNLLSPVHDFLEQQLHLDLHPHKVTVRKCSQGIDFLGLILRPHHRVLRTVTKRRMFRKLWEKTEKCRKGVVSEASCEQSLQSYLGVLSHADTYRLSQELQNRYWLWM